METITRHTMVVELSLKKRNMKLVNPLDTPITIMHRGVEYTAPARGVTKELTEEVGKFWLKLHEFLFVEGVKEVEVEPITPKKK